MIEEETNEIAEKLSQLIPLFTKKFLRPFELQTKNITSPLQLHVMLILKEKELLTMSDISKEMDVSKQQMTPIINKLHDAGFVNREHDKIDKRSVNISLTRVGVDFIENLCNDINSIMKQKIVCLGQDDLQSLHHALNDLYRIMHKITT